MTLRFMTAWMNSADSLVHPLSWLLASESCSAQQDVVFTGGLSLYEAKRREHANVHAFPSSIEREHFAQAISGKLSEPADQAMIAGPRAGFYGVVDERFDTELLREVAGLRPEVHFVILGPVVKIDAGLLPRGENIHYLGSKSIQGVASLSCGVERRPDASSR